MKFSMIFISILFFTLNAFSLDVGVLIGAGQSEVEGSNDALVTHEGGHRFGLPVKFMVSDIVDFRTGFFYSLRKFQTIAAPPGLEDVEYRLGYLEIPLVGQLNLSDWLAVIAGPIYGFNVSNKAKVDSLGEAFVEDVKKGSFLGQVGFALNFGNMGIDIIYEKGFTDVFQGDDAKWSYIGVNFIYWFVGSEDSYESFRY